MTIQAIPHNLKTFRLLKQEAIRVQGKQCRIPQEGKRLWAGLVWVGEGQCCRVAWLQKEQKGGKHSAFKQRKARRLAIFPAHFLDFTCGKPTGKVANGNCYWEVAVGRMCELVTRYLNFVQVIMGGVATARTLRTSCKFFVQHHCDFGQALNKWILSKNDFYVSLTFEAYLKS